MTASSSNTVQIHTFPEGEPDGILTRFTTNATHVAFNGSGSRVAAGSRYCRSLWLFGFVVQRQTQAGGVSAPSQDKTQ